MTRLPARLVLLGAMTTVAVLAGGVVSSPATAATGDVGTAGSTYTGTGGAATGEKPESKLWFHAGSWWASMQTASGGYGIHRLDRSTQTWQDTGTALDSRPTSRADAKAVGGRLYVASHVFTANSTNASAPSLLFRYTYDSATQTYVPDAASPSTITGTSSETLTVDRDSRGVLWATWMEQGTPRVTSSVDDGATWSSVPTPPDPTGAAAIADDISTLVAFGTSVGVMWSNQSTGAFLFAEHRDGDPIGTWQSTVVVVQGSNLSDDHINLKSDSTGRVYAAVKTSLDLTGVQTAAQNLLLTRDATTGKWASTTFGTVADCHTRPIVVVDEESQVLHVLATGATSGCPFSGYAGTVFEKTSALTSPAFASGKGTPILYDAASDNLNNVTAAKSTVSWVSGLVVLASNNVTARYWHSDRALTAPVVTPAPPTASFTATPVSGRAPLKVSFTDTSTGTPTSWLWKFGNGATSTAQNPIYTYTSRGTYTVTLTATNAGGSSTVVKSGLIRVGKKG